MLRVACCFFHTVQLYDSTFNLIDAARVNIKVGAACLCFGICGCVVSDTSLNETEDPQSTLVV